MMSNTMVSFPESCITKVIQLPQTPQSRATTQHHQIPPVQMNALKTQLYKNNTDPTESLIPRTQALKGLITTAYKHFQAGIDLTFHTMDYCNKPQKTKSSKRTQTNKHKRTNTTTKNHNPPTQHESTLIHSQTQFDKIQANLLVLKSKLNKTKQQQTQYLHHLMKMKLYTENLATFTTQTNKLLLQADNQHEPKENRNALLYNSNKPKKMTNELTTLQTKNRKHQTNKIHIKLRNLHTAYHNKRINTITKYQHLKN